MKSITYLALKSFICTIILTNPRRQLCLKFKFQPNTKPMVF
ncbi:hypothetical protein [Moraxella lacunata]